MCVHNCVRRCVFGLQDIKVVDNREAVETVEVTVTHFYKLENNMNVHLQPQTGTATFQVFVVDLSTYIHKCVCA